ncbi:MAG: 4-(cytidine 5'-diphospho)-2-C-methyl-D-erythritol kinase [Syntrophobacteraceae bacterium]
MSAVQCEICPRGGEGADVIVRAPAKINLWLEVTGKREDGYHDLSSLMLPISVFDRMTLGLRPGNGPITLACDTDEIPCDERNLAWRAADLFLKATGKKAGVAFRIQKVIPWGAGLGGGSSDAAGVLCALNCFFEGIVSAGDLASMALCLGADVPFFLDSRPALATGVGEKLEFVPGVPDYPLVLIKPPIVVPTAWVYQNLKLTKSRAQIKLTSFEDHPYQLEGCIENDLEAVTVSRYPVIAEIKSYLLDKGAMAASMSGSGPTVFAVFSSVAQAEEAARMAKKQWSDCWVRAARVIGSKI